MNDRDILRISCPSITCSECGLQALERLKFFPKGKDVEQAEKQGTNAKSSLDFIYESNREGWWRNVRLASPTG